MSEIPQPIVTVEEQYVQLSRLLELLQDRKIEAVGATHRELRRFVGSLQTLQDLATSNGKVAASHIHKQIEKIEAQWKELPTERLGILGSNLRKCYEEFKEECAAYLPSEIPASCQAFNFAHEHPKATVWAVLIGLGAPIIAPTLTVGGLNLLGFSVAGPVAGSIAAGLQSAVHGGEIAPGSVFELSQSAVTRCVVVASVGEIAPGAVAMGAGVGLTVKDAIEKHQSGKREDDENFEGSEQLLDRLD